jgi:hypothetical protein
VTAILETGIPVVGKASEIDTLELSAAVFSAEIVGD